MIVQKALIQLLKLEQDCLKKKAPHPSSDSGLVLPSDTCRLLFRTAQNFIYQQKNSQNPPYECEFQALATTFHHLITCQQLNRTTNSMPSLIYYKQTREYCIKNP